MILIALGSNLPSLEGVLPSKTLQRAVQVLSQCTDIHVNATSRIWLSAPIPASEQPDFCNGVIRVTTSLSPQKLLKVMHQVEENFGRVRGVRNEPRVLDLDLLVYGDEVIRNETFHIPHPRMAERGFVLHPLREVLSEGEIAAGWVHPVSKISIDTMIESLPDEQICRASSEKLV